MAYHTPQYLFFFLPLALIAYQLTPKKMRWLTLLLAGYVYFWTFSGKLLVFLLGTTAFTWLIGEGIRRLKARCAAQTQGMKRKESAPVKQKYKKREKALLIVGIAVLLAVLGYLKYYNFFAANVNTVLTAANRAFRLEAKHLILPIGISFYTMQAIGYMTDVFWEKIPDRQPLGKVALFLGFFPQIMEGPISLYDQTADSLREGNPLRWENLKEGAVRILWGLFKKMIIADRLNTMVGAIFDSYENYHGFVIAAAAVAYTVQLYMEFSGSMDMIIGSGRMFGVTLPENFRQPFFSRSAAEFWRRWHITLGVWFKTYIFYPVSVSSPAKKWNRFGRKHLPKHLTKIGVSALALFPVWLCNGLWHGARWSYIFYGMYYFVILLCEVACEPLKEKLIDSGQVRENGPVFQTILILKTWVIIFVGELFFRANGLKAGFYMFCSMFREFRLRELWDGTLLSFGLDQADFFIIVIGCAVAALVGFRKERLDAVTLPLGRLRLPVRWAAYYGLILAIVIFGAYGTGYQKVDLIYAGF